MTRGNHELRWSKIAVEVVTIVLGILLALAADAARQYAADRGEEKEILAALRVEFAADVREIGNDQESRTVKLAAIERLSRVHAGLADLPPQDSLASVIEQIINYRFYTASHPVLDDVLSTGRLDLLRSDDLRRALMLFGQERSRTGVVEQEERTFVSGQLGPYLSHRLDLEAILSPRSPRQLTDGLKAVPALLADPTFGSLLNRDRVRTDVSYRFAGILLDAVLEVQKALGDGNR